MQSHRAMLLASAAITLLGISPAAAQETASGASTGAPIIEDIVVTARRKEEILQDVPLAVTAIAGDAVRERNIQTAADLQAVVPSLTVATSINRTSESFSLRGLGASQGNQVASTTVASVQVYINEVPGTSGVGSYYDLQNVQVLKGPQGTLFGRNTTGGAILFETKRPSYDLDGYVQVQTGNYDLASVEGAINIPVVRDVLAVRVAGAVYHRDGFTRNFASTINPDNSFTRIGEQKLDDRDYESGRISILFEPVAGLRNTTIYSYFHTDRNGDVGVLRTFNRDAVFAADLRAGLPAVVVDAIGLPGPIPLTLAGGPPTSGLATDFAGTVAAVRASGRFSFFSDAALQAIQAQQDACGIRCSFSGFLHSYEATTHIVSNITDWDISDGLTIRNIFGYNRQELRQAFDYEGTPLNMLGITNTSSDGKNLSQDNYSDELQLQGRSFNGALDWVIGGFAEYNNPGGFSETRSLTIGGLNLQRPMARGRTLAVFAQGTLDLSGVGLDGLKFTAGGRYTWDKRSGTAQQFNPITGNCSQGGAPGNGQPFDDATCRVDRSARFKEPTWTLSLDYKVKDGVLLYLASRRGYKPGGFNVQVPTTEYLTYDPETLTDVEFGMKSDWRVGDMLIRANLALFKSWYDDIIQQTGVTVNGQATSVLINGGKAIIKGLEFEGTIVPFDGLDISGFYSFTDAGYKDEPLVFTYSPRHKYNLSARYKLPVSDGIGEIAFSATYSHQSSFYGFNVPAEPFARLPGYGTLNLRLDWNGIGGTSIDASAFVTNVTKERYVQGRLTTFTSLGVVADTWGEPRMAGVQLRYRFGASADR